ncbi:MAG: ankyrin repeat domain-containing protein [Spirochaetes bacterium]|nr:ankyrin repeat domain-containing protein [Spirochaetota bacterium]
MHHYLEYKDNKSGKFWEILQIGSIIFFRFGKTGAEGQTQTKDFETEEMAGKEAVKLLNEKLKKGYIEKSSGKEQLSIKAVNGLTPEKILKKAVELLQNGTDKDFNLVLKLVDEVLMFTDKENNAFAIKAFTLHQLKRYQEAVDSYRIYFEKEEGSARRWTQFGSCCMDMGNIDEAKKCFEKAVEKDPEFSDAWLELGNVWKSENDIPKAMECTIQCLKAEPTEEGYYNLACYQSLLGNTIESIRALRHAAFIFDRKWLNEAAKDPDFDPVRNEKLFGDLLNGKWIDLPEADVSNQLMVNLTKSSNKYEIISAIKNGADPFEKDSNGNWYQNKEGISVLEAAVYDGNEQIVQLLLENGMPADIINGEGRTPLMYASYYPRIVGLLLKWGADPMHRDQYGCTPLHFPNNAESIQLLYDAGGDINALDEDGKTPLAEAVRYRNPESVRKILALGGDSAVQVKYRGYVIHIASWGNDKEGLQILKMIIDTNTDLLVKDDDGRTPYQLALKENYRKAAEMLAEAGGFPEGENQPNVGNYPAPRQSKVADFMKYYHPAPVKPETMERLKNGSSIDRILYKAVLDKKPAAYIKELADFLDVEIADGFMEYVKATLDYSVINSRHFRIVGITEAHQTIQTYKDVLKEDFFPGKYFPGMTIGNTNKGERIFLMAVHTHYGFRNGWVIAGEEDDLVDQMLEYAEGMEISPGDEYDARREFMECVCSLMTQLDIADLLFLDCALSDSKVLNKYDAVRMAFQFDDKLLMEQQNRSNIGFLSEYLIDKEN